MAKVRLEKASENEPLNKKLKTIKLDDQNKHHAKSAERPNKSGKPSNKQDQPAKTPIKVKIDKSAKLQAKDQPKSDDLKAKRQAKRQKKKLERLNKKKQANKKSQANKSDDPKPEQSEKKSKKNLHLNAEQKLASIFSQKNENNRTILNHYRNLVAKVLASDSQVHEIVKQVKQLILDVSLDKELRNYLINDLHRFVATLVHQRNLNRDDAQSNRQTDELLLTLIKFVALNSFFPTRPDESVAKSVGEDTVACFKNCFVKSIVLIVRNSINRKKKEVERPRLDMLYQVMKHVYTLMNNEESNELKEDFNKIFKKISNSYKQVQLKDEEKQEQCKLAAFFIFFVYLGVNVFDERESCIQMLEEVNECFKRFTSKTPDDPHWADVLTDIILSLLSTASSLKRAICDEVFGLIANEITKAGLEQLMTALISDNVEIEEEEMLAEDEQSENETDDQQESDGEGSGSDEETDDEAPENEEEVNDLEVDMDCAQEFVSNANENEQLDDESSEEESDGGESDTESIDDEFRSRVKAALGKAAVSEGEEDDFVLDDEQMFKFDEAIAKVFQEKKKLKHKDQELVEFKSRCFDLVQTLLNRKDLELSFLVEIAKNTLEVLSTNNTSKSFDLILKASASLKRYPAIEQSGEEAGNELNELLEKSLALVGKLPEKVRANLNCFIVWLLDRQPAAIEPILSDLDERLKTAPEVSLLIQLAERKKRLAELIFRRLIQIDLKKKNKNAELQSYFKLMSACCLSAEQSVADASKETVTRLLAGSLDILNAKRKDKRARVLVDELVRFLTLFIKHHVQLVKADGELLGRLTKLAEEQATLKLSKKLRQKWKATLKTVN